MFSFFGRERPQLQLYGKLPLAKDYLRVGCGDGSSRKLREWLDQAFGSARDVASQPVLGEPLRFLGQASDEPLQGCLWPSSDEGGKRTFPFALCVERKRRALLADLDEGLPHAEGIWRELETLREGAELAGDGARFLDAFRGRELDLQSIEPRTPGRANWGDWLDALWPVEREAGLSRALEQIRDLARASLGGPWRLPLARALPLRDQVLAWLFALTELGALPKGSVPTLFLPSGAGLLGVSTREPAFAVFAADPVSSEQVGWLLPANPDTVLGARDLSRGIMASEREPDADGERAPPLKDSLRAMLASVRARERGTQIH
jgi:hypothetical protein